MPKYTTPTPAYATTTDSAAVYRINVALASTSYRRIQERRNVGEPARPIVTLTASQLSTKPDP